MAKVVENSKGFKVIKIKATELMDVFFGSLGICDYCNNASFEGYYIAVLNSYYCQKCYDEWNERSVYFEEDKPFEIENFNFVIDKLKAKNMLEEETV